MISRRLTLSLFIALLIVVCILLVTVFVTAEEQVAGGGASAGDNSDNDKDDSEDAGDAIGEAGGDATGEGAGEGAVPEEEKEPEFPIILVHKDVSEGNTVPGKAVTVTVTVINVGSANAYNLELTDKAPFVDEQTVKRETLEPFANFSHEYKVTPQSIGHTALPQAEVSYAATDAADATKIRATSNEVREEIRDEKMSQVDVGERGFINVVTPDEYERMTSTHWIEYSLYGIFCALVIGLPYFHARAKDKQIRQLFKEAKKSK
jgi:preprotein translocase subunit SecG